MRGRKFLYHMSKWRGTRLQQTFGALAHWLTFSAGRTVVLSHIGRGCYLETCDDQLLAPVSCWTSRLALHLQLHWRTDACNLYIINAPIFVEKYDREDILRGAQRMRANLRSRSYQKPALVKLFDSRLTCCCYSEDSFQRARGVDLTREHNYSRWKPIYLIVM